MISPWRLVTARLVMTPVAAGDLRELTALKADPLAFAQMLGGVRSAQLAAEELAADVQAWGRYNFGMWSVRARNGGAFLGTTGLMHRPDGRGIALRFALKPAARGVGLACEAAFAALTYGHESCEIETLVAVVREENFASRTVLGAIGMTAVDVFQRNGIQLLVYHSVRKRNAR
jgi:RimJ/RimL family protein N-acetyltransferase